MKKKGIVNILFSVSGLILLGKLLGFVKQLYVAAKFGATIETDIVSLTEGFIANTQYLLVQVLLTSFTAVYIHAREENELEARRLPADAIKAFSMIALILVALIALLSVPIAHLLAPSYSDLLSAQVAYYLRIFSPLLILFIWIAVFHALLNSNERFIPGEFTSVFQSLITIGVVFLLSEKIGVRTLVVSLLAYTVFNTAFLGAYARKHITWTSGNPFKNEHVRTLLKMAAPLVLGYAMIYVNQQVDKILVTGLASGTVTALGYAAVLSNLVSTFIITFCSILFTYVTTAIAQDDHKKAAILSEHSTFLLLAAFLPICVISVIEAEDIVEIAFGRGAFDAESVKITAMALRGYAYTFVPLIIREVYSRLSYGYQDSKHPMINSSLSILVNIGLSIALVQHMGVFGVTFASSVAVAVCGILNMWCAGRHNEFLHARWLLGKLPLIVLGGVVCTLLAKYCTVAFSTYSAALRFLLITLIACAAYFAVIFPLLYKVYVKDNGLSIFGVTPRGQRGKSK